ncbi:MAG TPA: glycosyltransferase family 2 protein [Elusimicrobiota bacterium]|nr:glycosyltransferase family 2 protein [Elusimicrobiota bacterium]
MLSKNQPLLSAVIIAKDEERDLPGCLESLRGLCDETAIVIGAKSADKTEAIARAAGAKVSVRAFDGYAGQKQAALELASGEWVLSIDCDERVSPELAHDIKRALAAPGNYAGFEIPFRVFFLGKRLRFGGLGSERHLRLFKRAAGRFAGGQVHEGIQLDGPVGRLAGAMNHVPYRDISEYVAKMDFYTRLAAKKRFEKGGRFHFWHHALLPWDFFARAVLKLGFLDGQAGLVWAGLSAFHHWLKYVKLAELEDSQKAQ